MLRYVVIGLVLSHGAWAQTSLPAELAAPGETEVARLHAVGAQIYECKADAAGALAWQFREPVASLMEGGKTVGRHYAGPSWELGDGSAVTGKLASRAPGASDKDIPWLRLDATQKGGAGRLATVTTVQRINTEGGFLAGACETAGALRGVAYASDYVFLARPANR
jgi:hypothetical protein